MSVQRLCFRAPWSVRWKRLGSSGIAMNALLHRTRSVESAQALRPGNSWLRFHAFTDAPVGVLGRTVSKRIGTVFGAL